MLAGKVAIVTGAGMGIGRAIAQRFAREGAKVTVSDIKPAEGKKTVHLIKEAGGEAVFVQADSSKEKDIEALVNTNAQTFGHADILVNNAAAFWFGTIQSATRADWLRLFQTNVVGYSDAIREVLPGFQAKGKGVVVNVGSISSFIAQPDMLVYNSVKAGVAQLTRCLALDLAKYNVRVNAVCPGPIFTPASVNHMNFLGLSIEQGMKEFASGTVMKRMGTPEEIAGPAVFLASDMSSFVTGHMLMVDGGVTID